MIRKPVLALVVCSCAASCFGQAETPLERVRALRLPTVGGSVPVIYSVAAKARAERYRTALETAHRWYEAQLGIGVQVTLAVLDRRDWARASSVPYPMPNSKPGLVTLPARMEDFPGFTTMGQDADILAEVISFHEMGHLIAAKVGIQPANGWVNELVANIFAQEYIGARQPGMKAYLPRPVPDTLSPRYTSLADLDYLQGSLPQSNYAWFQFQLNRLAFLVAQKRDLRQVVEQLRIAFPAGPNGRLPLQETLRRMEVVSPGLKDALGLLAGPATMAKVQELPCLDSAITAGAPTLLVIDNRTSHETLVLQAGKDPIRVAAGRWQRLDVMAGEQLKLATGRCLVALSEPTLAVIENP
jgi:hypothetical protein